MPIKKSNQIKKSDLGTTNSNIYYLGFVKNDKYMKAVQNMLFFKKK